MAKYNLQISLNDLMQFDEVSKVCDMCHQNISKKIKVPLNIINDVIIFDQDVTLCSFSCLKSYLVIKKYNIDTKYTYTWSLIWNSLKCCC